MADLNKNSIIKYGAIILVIVMLNVIGGFFVAKKLLDYAYNTDGVTAEETASASEEKSKTGKDALPGIMYELEPINLNPSQSNGEIFSCDIVLEASNQEIINELTTRNAQIMDLLSDYLSHKTVSDLSQETKWGDYKKEMTDIINTVMQNGDISGIYVPQKIIQFE